MNPFNPGVQMGSSTPRLDNIKIVVGLLAIPALATALLFTCPLAAGAYVLAVLWAF